MPEPQTLSSEAESSSKPDITGESTPPVVMVDTPPVADEASDGFQVIGEAQASAEPEAVLGGEEKPAEKPKPDLKPYTDDQILEVLAQVTLVGSALLGKGPKTEAEVRAFERGVEWINYPILRTSKFMKRLDLGGALLEQFGLGQGDIPDGGLGAKGPPWVRLLAGGLGMGIAIYGGINAMGKERQKTSASPRPGRGAAGGGDVPHE